MKHYYITTAIPYVNGDPHIGHALEFVQADTIARFHRDVLHEETTLLSGSDENALKNVQAAETAHMDVQAFVDAHAQRFQELAVALNVRFDLFQKGTHPHHFAASQKLWELCVKNDDIYKDTYTGLYCVGCEAFYQPNELNENGECFEHPGIPLEKVSEENYYFRLAKYQPQLIELIEHDKLKIIPETRKNEILSFLKEPLQDISISRTNERARNWGVPVPGDDTQRMYVWFDALNIYQSGVGFGSDEKRYESTWPADVHVIGKGIIRFHAVYWPAFLLSAGLELPKQLFVHGYFTVNGQKMSKTLGNVIDPFALLKKYGTDAVRYYFLREIPPSADGDFSVNRMNQLYESDLANELGNLVSRLTTMAATDQLNIEQKKEMNEHDSDTALMTTFQFDKVLETIWEEVKIINKELNEKEPWTLAAENRRTMLTAWLQRLNSIGRRLAPFLPETAKKIQIATTGSIKKIAPLFPRI